MQLLISINAQNIIKSIKHNTLSYKCNSVRAYNQITYNTQVQFNKLSVKHILKLVEMQLILSINAGNTIKTESICIKCYKYNPTSSHHTTVNSALEGQHSLIISLV